ncbi:MAG: host-nuclease inhibitor Gam family protein [Desulfovibrionaceae bacterium]|nr:host-nuclease inhibitor Gam family protein [Desulfovibrionaceae bacterium]
MATRSKPKPHIVANMEQAEGAMAELASIDRKLKSIQAEMNSQIDLAKKSALASSASLDGRRKELESALAVYATLNRLELFKDGSKSLDLGYGIIGFRASTKIVQQSKITAQMTLDRLHQFGMLDGIRVKEELNKDAMASWTDEKLETIGLRRQKSDGFYVEVKEDELPREV